VADGAYIGGTGLHDIDHHNRHCAWGIWIGPPQRWGRGYGTEACMLSVEYAFRHLAMEKVSLHVYEGNDRARRSYEKAGFVSEGTLRRHFWRDGELIDVEMMAAFRDNPLYAQRIAIHEDCAAPIA
jgi:RimJ/RimL family protein N-acetyltransferase